MRRTRGCFALALAIAACFAACAAPLPATDQTTLAYAGTEPVCATGFDEPLVELTFTLLDPDEEAVVRLMQREGEVTQSFLLRGSHWYVSEGFLLTRQAGGFRGRIILSKETRGGPARGMGTPRGSRFLEIELKYDGESLSASCRSDDAPVPVAARLISREDGGKKP
jgi:hypothetical protein